MRLARPSYVLRSHFRRQTLTKLSVEPGASDWAGALLAVTAAGTALVSSKQRDCVAAEPAKWASCDENQRPIDKTEWSDFDADQLFWERLNGEGRFASGSTLRLLRQDALSKRWVCFMKEASTGGKKPRQYTGDKKTKKQAHELATHDPKCPFCLGKEGDTEVLRVWSSGEMLEREGAPHSDEDKINWKVRVLRNPFPYLLTPPGMYKTEFPGDKKKHAACFGDNDNQFSNPDADNPMYRMIDGIGASEVIVESPVHNELLGISNDEQVYQSLRAMAARGRTLRTNPYVRQLIYFKQYGAESGSSLIHPHMQLCTIPMISEYMKSKLREHQAFYEEFGCHAVKKLYVEDVTGGEALGISRLLHQTEHFVASIPFAQVARGRIVIAPKRHNPRFEDCTDEELKDLGRLLRLIMAALYRLKDDPPYNLFWESAPPKQALQEPGWRESVEDTFCWTLNIRVPPSISGFGLASGIEVTKQLPEEEARDMREALLLEARRPLRAALHSTDTPNESVKLSFPDSLGPFMMMQVDLARAFNAYTERHRYLDIDPSADKVFVAGFDLRRWTGLVAGVPATPATNEQEVVMRFSPMHTVTFDQQHKAAACIPQSAKYYSWAYPPMDMRNSHLFSIVRGSERAFLKNGGFIYFNEELEAVGASAISYAPAGTSMLFGEPKELPQEVVEMLDQRRRWQPVSKKTFAEKGATYYAWIRPMEFTGSVQCPHGCFAYQFEGKPPIFYPLEQ